MTANVFLFFLFNFSCHFFALLFRYCCSLKNSTEECHGPIGIDPISSDLTYRLHYNAGILLLLLLLLIMKKGKYTQRNCQFDISPLILVTSVLFLRLNSKVDKFLEWGFPKTCHLDRQYAVAQWDPPLGKLSWEQSLCLAAQINAHHRFTFLVHGWQAHLFFFLKWEQVNKERVVEKKTGRPNLRKNSGKWGSGNGFTQGYLSACALKVSGNPRAHSGRQLFWVDE